MKDKNNVNPILRAALPLVIVSAYVLLGFLCDRGWAVGWILFLLIPIIESLVTAIKTKNPSSFAYPVLVAAIFLFVGMVFHFWHPMWIIFFTVPVYYAICDAIKKSKSQKADNQSAPQPYTTVDGNSVQGTYYQPQQDSYRSEQKKNITAIIITVIVSVAVVAIVAIVCVFAWMSGSINIPKIDLKTEDTGYTSVMSEVDVADIKNIELDWVAGSVNIGYYDGDKITFSEAGGDESDPMTCKIKGNTLYIEEYKSLTGSKRKSKTLTLKLPKDFKANTIDIDSVSAEIKADSLSTYTFDVETVSGNVNASFATQPSIVDIECVSANANLLLPPDLSGFSVDIDSVSGQFTNAANFDYGDKSTSIDFESVSGNLTIDKTK